MTNRSIQNDTVLLNTPLEETVGIASESLPVIICLPIVILFVLLFVFLLVTLILYWKSGSPQSYRQYMYSMASSLRYLINGLHADSNGYNILNPPPALEAPEHQDHADSNNQDHADSNNQDRVAPVGVHTAVTENEAVSNMRQLEPSVQIPDHVKANSNVDAHNDAHSDADNVQTAVTENEAESQVPELEPTGQIPDDVKADSNVDPHSDADNNSWWPNIPSLFGV